MRANGAGGSATSMPCRTGSTIFGVRPRPSSGTCTRGCSAHEPHHHRCSALSAADARLCRIRVSTAARHGGARRRVRRCTAGVAARCGSCTRRNDRPRLRQLFRRPAGPALRPDSGQDPTERTRPHQVIRAMATRAAHPAPSSLRNADWLVRPETRAVFAALAAGGYEARAVGGAVRNTLLGRPVTDVDIATPARPEDVMRLAAAAGLETIPTGVAHGTVMVLSGGIPFEVTTLRQDVETHGRHATVAFTGDWAADAARRDFTVNALYAGS